MEEYKFIKGLKKIYVYHEDEETVFYYTDDMLANGFIIIETCGDSTGSFKLGIDILYIDLQNGKALNASKYNMYYGNVLQEIQEYRVLKDILDFYNELNKEEFVDLIDEMCSSSLSANQHIDPYAGAELLEHYYSTYKFVVRQDKRRTA